MKQPSQEDMLGYVLGALEAQEQRDLQQQLDDHPQSARLEEQLLEIRAAMAPLDYVDTSGHRPGLARRTCEFVANYQNNPSAFENAPGATPLPADVDAAFADVDESNKVGVASKASNTTATSGRLARSAERMMHPTSWSRMDMLACVAMFAVIGCVIFPALSYSRYNSQVLACQDNLRQVGSAMMRYSDCNDGEFIAIPREGNLAASGCYAMMLKDGGYVENDSVFSCAGVMRDNPVKLPTMTQVSMASGSQLAALQRDMGGDFGHTMGFSADSGYRAPRNEGLTHLVLLADTPSTTLPGRRSANHRGKGQNCLFGDGRVEFISGHTIGNDAIFENDYGFVAPGSHHLDNVIAPSHLSPCGVQYPK